MLAFLVCRILPWITIAVLFTGILARTRRWMKGGRPKLTLFPSGGSTAGAWKRIFREIFVFESLFKSNRGLWGGTWVFHAGLLLVLAGHARLVAEFPRLRSAFGVATDQADALGQWIGGGAGILVLAMGCYLLARRLVIRSVREISGREDYLVLGVLLAVIVSGDALRFMPGSDLAETRAFLRGLFLLQPVTAPSHLLFLIHFLLAQALLIIVPFSKFMHIPGVFFTKSLLLKP
ncbi:MAG: respiratory nitrate reductase subunit gamma [bacterium]